MFPFTHTPHPTPHTLLIDETGESKMKLTIEIPDNIAARMEGKWGNVEKRALELLAADAYRAKAINSAQVGRMLKLSTRLQEDAFLKQEGVPLHYTEADLERDIQTLNKLMPE